MPTNLNEAFALFIATMLITAFTLFAVYNFFNQPVMVKSWETQQCVCVETSKGEKVGCNSLSEKDTYDTRWVK